MRRGPRSQVRARCRARRCASRPSCSGCATPRRLRLRSRPMRSSARRHRPSPTFGAVAGGRARACRGDCSPTVWVAPTRCYASGSVLLVVDGYNVTKTGWPNASLEVERESLLSAVHSLHLTSGTDVVVAFDGDGTRTFTGPPPRRREDRLLGARRGGRLRGGGDRSRRRRFGLRWSSPRPTAGCESTPRPSVRS